MMVVVRTAEAFEQARLMGNSWVGSEHFLLALLARPSQACEVLNELGVTYDAVAKDVRSDRGDPDNPSAPYDPQEALVGPNPAGHQLTGLAEGLALAWGFSSPEPEHWLIAMMYGASGLLSRLAARGVTQDVVLAGLASRGVAVPKVPPIPFKPWRGDQKVYVNPELLDAVIQALTERHPAGSEWRWGFNWVPGPPRRARIHAEDGIPLAQIVAEVDHAQLR